MKNCTAKTILLVILITLGLSACSNKGSAKPGETSKTDTAAQAKEDSTDAAEAKDTKEVLDVVRK